VELDSLQEKNEELSAKVELLKAELEGGGGASADGVSNYQVKQLEQQNEKLKEALVKYVSSLALMLTVPINRLMRIKIPLCATKCIWLLF
jgi:hypothetical protein